MKGSILILFISLITGFQPGDKTKKTSDWELIKNKSGITVYTRKVEGWDIKQVKAVSYVKSSLSALVAIVHDVSSQTKWVYKCKSAKILKEVSLQDYYYYNETEAPWPISNRDNISHIVVSQDKKTKIVTMTITSVPNFIPPFKDIVRVKKLQSEWKFVPQKNGIVQINLTILTNLGGNLPAWLINLTIADGPFETVYDMKNEVVKPKYQNTVYNFIEEL